MILAFDSYYYNNKAKTVCVAFENWQDAKPAQIYSEIIEGVADYEPGSFYKRELPCILSLLKKIDVSDIESIIIDGFVVLDDKGKLGLGGYLYKKLEAKIPIIGVAKSNFFSNKNLVKQLLRGESKKPLFITAMGLNLDLAYHFVQSMHGKYRMPTLLQILDTETKNIDSEPG